MRSVALATKWGWNDGPASWGNSKMRDLTNQEKANGQMTVWIRKSVRVDVLNELEAFALEFLLKTLLT